MVIIFGVALKAYGCSSAKVKKLCNVGYTVKVSRYILCEVGLHCELTCTLISDSLWNVSRYIFSLFLISSHSECNS